VKRGSTKGFSLVEIVLALGVISFALVAIIGLLPIGLASGRASIQETRANLLAQQIFATLRSQPFTAVDMKSLGPNTTVDLSTENGPLGTPLYATYDGQFVGGADYFTIQITFQNAPNGLISGTANEVHLKISGRELGAQRMDYVSVIGSR
jgi:uncharacterized protein (TIGR02598 family)